jgi:hypothetical protein
MAKNKYSSMDAGRDAHGRINPAGFRAHVGAFRDDPGGKFIDENTPAYLSQAGYGYNPSQTYSFKYTDSSGKGLSTESPLSQEEYKTGGYTLKSASYRPVDQYFPTSQKTTQLGAATETKDNPYVKQRTFFSTDAGGNVSQKQTMNTIFKSSSGGVNIGGDPDYNTTRYSRGSNVSWWSKPTEGSRSNVISNITSPIRMDIEKGWSGGFGSINSPGLKFFHRYSKPGTKPSFIKGGANVGILASKYNRGTSKDQGQFRSAIGQAAWNILRGTTTTSTSTGRTLYRFQQD